jgi:AAA domain
MNPRPVVYISAEGRGLSKRIRAWIAHHFPGAPANDVLRGLPFYAIEAAVNLSNAENVKSLCAAVDALKISPCLIILDTLSRNSSFVEESNSNMAEFLRHKYRCTLLLIHHVGHKSKERARGPSNLIGNTDASFIVHREDKSYYITLETERLKDSDVPDPLTLEAREILLGTVDDDGEREKSLVLVPATVIRFATRQTPTGKNQAALLSALRNDADARGGEGWTREEVGAIAKRLGLNASRRREVLEALMKHGILVQKDGVWLLAE